MLAAREKVVVDNVRRIQDRRKIHGRRVWKNALFEGEGRTHFSRVVSGRWGALDPRRFVIRNSGALGVVKSDCPRSSKVRAVPRLVTRSSSEDIFGSFEEFFFLVCLRANGSFLPVVYTFSSNMQAGLQPYDPAVQLVVVNRNGILGLRSAIAEGRLLGCNRHYHLTFEHWQMESQEAWSLEGDSLLDCTLRNEMHKLTLNIRVTVLAEPTDILGNIRITPALITTSVSRLDRSETSKPSSASSSHVKGRVVLKGERDSGESPRLYLVRPGSNTKCSNPFTHQRDKSSSQEIKTISAMLSKTGGQGKALHSSSQIVDERSTTSSPTGGMYTFSSFPKSDSPQDTLFPTQITPEEAKPDGHTFFRETTAANWKRTIPSGENGVQHSSLPAKTRFMEPESHSDANSQEHTRNHAVETSAHPSKPSPPENPRKVRKWKRNSEGNQKVCIADLHGDKRPNLELKLSPVSVEVYDADEEGTLLSPGRSNKSSSPNDGEHSPHVVVKRQTRYLATKVDSDVSPTTPQHEVKSDLSESSGEKLKYSKSQLDAALNNLRKDAARQEKEKVIHWKLQAAVRLLKSETQQKLTLIAKIAAMAKIDLHLDVPFTRNAKCCILLQEEIERSHSSFTYTSNVHLELLQQPNEILVSMEVSTR
ncbi:hypothetical protein AXG93_1864s1020 [Marchantia polymorpha subsp. ruderalis]|uniref:Uncharacterized protein n=1 Tax=Marchantia polymorpha subsp. ruderalis TaxID=1480154 RepID=A0A176WR23_MARPO|nr:hypothetical protein AXG93_1864s1020 [Marchantia polymorpha subsp. ruderalis]